MNTDPSEIPPDVARKIIAARDAHLEGDDSEVWHQLYAIADPAFTNFEPWKVLEEQAKR